MLALLKFTSDEWPYVSYTIHKIFTSSIMIS